MTKLERLMHEQSLSQAALARRAELNQCTVNQIVRGRLIPYPSQLLKLTRGLGLPDAEADSLLDDDQ